MGISNTISQDYQRQMQELHNKGKFNNGADQFDLVETFIKEYNPTNLIDFGCGKGALIATIKEHYPSIDVFGYDPGNEEFNHMPNRTFDTIISTDAIEHIEPEYLVNSLKIMSDKMERCGFFRIACHPAKKVLPDGRNCHLIVEEPTWWREQILKHMNVDIVWDRVVPFDRRDINPLLYGSKYDLIMIKK
jgi:cyclopropane fatty-acyl-phospholipid synthase-like methyltransferase